MEIKWQQRVIQIKYNKEHNIKPKTVQRDVTQSITNLQKSIEAASGYAKKTKLTPNTKTSYRILELEQLMKEAAEELDFEKAIALREEYLGLKKSNL